MEDEENWKRGFVVRITIVGLKVEKTKTPKKAACVYGACISTPSGPAMLATNLLLTLAAVLPGLWPGDELKGRGAEAARLINICRGGEGGEGKVN